MQPNMKKEYRAELKILRKNRRVVLRDWKAYVAAKRRELRVMEREINRSQRSVQSGVNKFDHRIAILEGRLS